MIIRSKSALGLNNFVLQFVYTVINIKVKVTVTRCRLLCIGYSIKAWARGYKTFSCSTQLSMKFSLLINVQMPTIVGILTCMSRKNNILGLTEP